MTGATLALVSPKLHAAVLRAMQENGVDLTEGDAVLLAYTGSLAQFFQGLAKEGHPRERVEGWVDWLAANVKHNVFPPEGPSRTASK